jgi:YVTN family beta-propeller protein
MVTISVIDTTTDRTTATLTATTALYSPRGLAVSPDGGKLYITNGYNNPPNYKVSVVDTATNTITTELGIESVPNGLVVSPDSTKIYVTSFVYNNQISVFDTATYSRIALISLQNLNLPRGIDVIADGSKVYVAGTSVSVIAAATNTVSATIAGVAGGIVAVAPDGSKVYVTNGGTSSLISVIDTATNAVATTIRVGNGASRPGVSSQRNQGLCHQLRR